MSCTFAVSSTGPIALRHTVPYNFSLATITISQQPTTQHWARCRSRSQVSSSSTRFHRRRGRTPFGIILLLIGTVTSCSSLCYSGGQRLPYPSCNGSGHTPYFQGGVGWPKEKCCKRLRLCIWRHTQRVLHPRPQIFSVNSYKVVSVYLPTQSDPGKLSPWPRTSHPCL